MTTATDWKTEYPTVADMERASDATILAWTNNLPPAQTDVQRTVWRRIDTRAFNIVSAHTKTAAPDIADKWNALSEMAKKLGIDMPKM